MRSSLALLTLTAGLAVPTGVASAATVSVPTPGDSAIYQSGPGASDLTSRLDFSAGVLFKDFIQPILPGANCVAGPPVTCSATDQDLRFGNANDRFRGFSLGPIAITAGGGADTIRTAGSYNSVSAGAGADRVWENGNANGNVAGDGGADKLYSFEASARLSGGTGDDLLTTSSARWDNALAGGDDDDELVVTGIGSGTVDGDGGADVIVLDSAFGGYTADGGAGADVIAGSPGADTVLAGSGNDVVSVGGDGVADSVDCGAGSDKVYAGPEDTVSRNCEVRLRSVSLPQVAAARADAAAFVAAMPAIPAF